MWSNSKGDSMSKQSVKDESSEVIARNGGSMDMDVESDEVKNGDGSKRTQELVSSSVDGMKSKDGGVRSPRSRSVSASRSKSPYRSSRSKSRSPIRPRRSHSRSRSKSKSKSRSRSRSRSNSRQRHRSSKRKSRQSRSRSPNRKRSGSSSSRDTYDSFKPSSPQRALGEFPCRKCDRTDFDSIRELSEHQIRAHGANLLCAHCEKEASSVQKLVDHTKHRHPDLKLVCEYCKEEFCSKVSTAKDSKWEDFRAHVYKECLKEKMYSHERLRGRSGSGGNAIAQRGKGRCPHGPPVRCKNFPKCPGVKCYYFHGYCRYDVNCVKKECPFDHSDRPRICLSCLRDHKVYSNRDKRSSRR